jgi:hypothetical protein
MRTHSPATGLRLGLGFALLLPGLVIAAELESQPKIDIPSPTAILAPLKKSHPRLLALPDDWSALRQKVGADAELGSWRDKLLVEGRQILEAAPSRYEIPDGLRLLATSRRVVQRVYTLGLLYRLTGEARYAERAWKELAAAAEFPDWNPRHFLDTAEMTHAFAIGYDWLHDVWTPEQRATLRRAMLEKGLKPALKVYQSRSGWHKSRHNWNQVCNGGIGMGALALADEEPALCGEALHAALTSLPLAMAEFAPDGAWNEGPGYWNYATAYNVVLLAGLDTALGTDFGLSRLPAFAETGFFPLYLTGPTGRTFNYADGSDALIRAPQLFWLSRKFNEPLFAWYQHSVASPSAQDLLWHREASAGPKSLQLPLDKYYRAAEVVFLRSEWENPKALFAGLKAGDNKANHSHLDLGSFVFDALGVRWIVEMGADDYNLPGYFGGNRWNYYRLRAEGQNTLLINPDQAPDQDPSAATKVIRFQSKPDRGFAVLDLTPAYSRHATQVLRGFSLPDRNRLLVQDELQLPKPSEVWWGAHTRAEIQLQNEGRQALLSQSGAAVRIELLSPGEARFQVLQAQPLPTSPQPEKQARNEQFRKLAIHLKDVTATRIAVQIIPVDDRARTSATTAPFRALAEW